MARFDLLTTDASWDVAEPRTPIDDLIRPGLRRAFPLPAQEEAGDERFQMLLDALAERSRGRSQAAERPEGLRAGR